VAPPQPPEPKPAAAPAPAKPAVAVAKRPSEPRPAPEPKSASAAHARTIRISVANAPDQLTVLIDGRPGKLPVRIPADGREHLLRFESNRTRPETRTVTADRDQSIELANKPKLLLE
jgi:hypothetical protein